MNSYSRSSLTLIFLIIATAVITTVEAKIMTKNVYRFFVPTANQANLWGLIDDQGKLILKPNYAWINEFDEGYQWPVNVQNREGKWGYVAADGSIVHEIELEQAQAFSKDGFARFKKNEKWGFIRADGSYLVSPSYDDARLNKRMHGTISTPKGSVCLMSHFFTLTLLPKLALR